MFYKTFFYHIIWYIRYSPLNTFKTIRKVVKWIWNKIKIYSCLDFYHTVNLNVLLIYDTSTSYLLLIILCIFYFIYRYFVNCIVHCYLGFSSSKKKKIVFIYLKKKGRSYWIFKLRRYQVFDKQTIHVIMNFR
jgi:hypothetical protein